MHTGSYLGATFEVRRGRRMWFWFVTDPRGNGASIGVAANETEATCEARSSIEEMAARRWSGSGVSQGLSKIPIVITHKWSPAGSSAIVWNELLANLERYLTLLCSECV
jgi:hypothetical protein